MGLPLYTSIEMMITMNLVEKLPRKAGPHPTFCPGSQGSLCWERAGLDLVVILVIARMSLWKISYCLMSSDNYIFCENNIAVNY